MYKNHLFTGILLSILMCSAPMALSAQGTADPVAYRIEGLTSELRDAIARSASSEGITRVEYACIPAGILVLSLPATAREGDLEQWLRRKLGPTNTSISARRVRDTMEQLMDQCAQAR